MNRKKDDGELYGKLTTDEVIEEYGDWDIIHEARNEDGEVYSITAVDPKNPKKYICIKRSLK